MNVIPIIILIHNKIKPDWVWEKERGALVMDLCHFYQLYTAPKSRYSFVLFQAKKTGLNADN